MFLAGNPVSPSKAMADTNITPLVDVLLTMLIIFMVTAPLVTRSIPFPLGDSVQPKAVEPTVLGLSIRETGEIVLDGHSTSRLALDQRLRAVAAGGTPILLEIRPEARSSYDNLAQVLSIASNNSIGNLRVIAPRDH